MVGGTLADMVFLLAIAVAPQYWFLLLAYFGLQVASNVAHGPYQGLIPDRVPPARWGQASGVKQLAEIVGIIVTSLAAGYLLSRGEVLLTILSIMGVLLVTLAITAWGVKEEPLQRAEPAPLLKTVTQTFRIDLRRYSGFAWLLVSRLLIVVAMNLVRNYILYYIQYLLQMTAQQAADAAGTLMAILAVAIAAIVYPAGALSDRIGRKPLVVASGLVGAAGSLSCSWRAPTRTS
ncbi:MAG TPA: MFS transporter, partial [Anaerolineae bacterium]|nr:MFS transporter [Anaerolineae bacterium]